jgi:hypothetical protein
MSSGLRSADFDEVVDELEVGRVVGEQRDVVGVGGGGYGEVECAPAGLAAAGLYGGGEASPFACDSGVDRQRLECGLDHAQAQRAPGAFVVVAGDQRAEVKLGQAGGADRALEFSGIIGADQHGRVEQRPHLCEGVGELARKALEVAGKGPGSGRVPDLGEVWAADPLASSCWSELGDGPSGDGDRELLARFRAAENVRDVVAQLLLRMAMPMSLDRA